MAALRFTASTSLLNPARNAVVRSASLVAAAATATLEVFDGVINQVATFTVHDGGTGYVVGDQLTISPEFGGEDATFEVATVDGLVGEILTEAIAAGGTGYEVGDTLTLETEEEGVAAEYEVATIGEAGVITGVTLVSGGAGYIATETYTTTTDSTLGDGATITASTVAVGEIATVTLLTAGNGFEASKTYDATTDGDGENAEIDVDTVSDPDSTESIGKISAVANTQDEIEFPSGLLTNRGISVKLTGSGAIGYIYKD
jgi:hypothetical protein